MSSSARWVPCAAGWREAGICYSGGSLGEGWRLSAAGLGGILESNASTAVCSHLPVSLVRSITSLAVGTARSNGMELTTPLAMILEGVLNVLPIKKVVILATAISAGTIAFAVVERTTAGQTPEPKSQATPSGGGAGPRVEAGDRISVLYRLETEKNPYVLAIEAKLKEKVSVQFDVTTLGEAVKFLQDRSPPEYCSRPQGPERGRGDGAVAGELDRASRSRSRAFSNSCSSRSA